MITKKEFVELMKFPCKWIEYGLYPDELFRIQLEEYEPGSEIGSEHFRNGAFYWWLSKKPTKETLLKLAVLAKLDPEPGIPYTLQKYIVRNENCDDDVIGVLQS